MGDEATFAASHGCRCIAAAAVVAVGAGVQEGGEDLGTTLAADRDYAVGD